MESAAEFTAVPGWGGVAMGITALVAALVASQQSTPRAWFGVWLVEALIAVAIAGPASARRRTGATRSFFPGRGGNSFSALGRRLLPADC